MADHIACYWGGLPPSSGVRDAAQGHRPDTRALAYVRAIKEMVVAEDRRVLAMIDSLAAPAFG